MRRLRVLAGVGLLVAMVSLAFAQTPINTKTNSQPWHWKYNGLNLTETAYWRVLAYPENEDTTANAQDTLAYLATAYDTTWTHDGVEYDSYLYVGYNDTLGISLILRENVMFPGPEAPLGFIHSMTAFDASVVPPSALNPDSTYDGLRTVSADTLSAVDILTALLAELAEIRGDTLTALDSSLMRFASPATFDSLVTIGAYKLPLADGAANRVLKTNGTGTVTWQPDATGAGGSAYAESLETVDGRFDADRYLNAAGDVDTTNIADAEFQAYIEAHNPSAGGTMHTVKENDAVIEAEVHILDFLGADFDVTETPAGEANIVSAAAITRDSEWDSAAEINAATADADFLTTEVGDISGVTAGTALGGGGTTGAVTVNLLMDAAGGLEAVDDSANVKLADTTLTVSPAGVQVTPSVFQPLEATLTDIADGTIAEDLVNTANPWADNEVADNLTASSYLTLAVAADTVAANATTAVTAGAGLGGGGTVGPLSLAVQVKAAGGIELGSDSLGVKTDGASLSKSASGLRVNRACGVRLFPATTDSVDKFYCASADSGDVVLASWYSRLPDNMPLCFGAGIRPNSIGGACVEPDTIMISVGCWGGGWISGDSCYAWEVIEP